MAASWYVVSCQQGLEYIARDNLVEQGFDVFLPEYVRRVRHARKIKKVKRPLYHQYIFVEIDMSLQAWRCINGTRGVSQILCGSDQRPSAIGPVAMYEIRKIAAEYDEEIFDEFPISRDDVVMIVNGAFKKFTATVKRVSHDGSKVEVEVQTPILGRHPKATIAREDLAPVA